MAQKPFIEVRDEAMRRGVLKTPSRTELMSPDEIVVRSRTRSTLNETTVEHLMEDIRRIGLQTPVTVRRVIEGDDEEVVLVTGRHRLEACRRLDIQLMDCLVFEGTEDEARLWEIAENLHRAELTVLERDEHIAEWVKLTEEKNKGASCADIPRGRGRPQGGINAAVRDLGIDRTEAQRAVKIASLTPEAKQAAVETGRADNQTALLKAAAAPQEEQARVIREYAPESKVKPAPGPLNDFETEEQWMNAIMRVWNKGAPQWRERFLSTVDTPVFDRTMAGAA